MAREGRGLGPGPVEPKGPQPKGRAAEGQKGPRKALGPCQRTTRASPAREQEGALEKPADGGDKVKAPSLMSPHQEVGDEVKGRQGACQEPCQMSSRPPTHTRTRQRKFAQGGRAPSKAGKRESQRP